MKAIKKKKLVVILPYFYPKIGGAENYAYNISKGLQDTYNWEVVVITSNHYEKKYKEEMIQGMHVYRLPWLFKASNTPIHPLWYFSIKKIMQKEKPDIVNAHTPVPFISDMGARVAKKLQVPFVLTYHNDLIKDVFLLNIIIKLYYSLLGKKTLALSQKIITSSEYYAERSAYVRTYKNKIAVVYPGITLKRFLPENVHIKRLTELQKKYKDKEVILFVGTLDKTHSHKGLSYLLEAVKISKVSHPRVHLLIVGKGDNIEPYKQQCAALGLENNTTFTGFVTDEDLPYYFMIGEMVVLPSYSEAEGFGMVLLEAGACKKPVIGSRIGGIPFVIAEGENGFLTKPKDAISLSGAILTLLNNKAMAEKMGKNNFTLVTENYTWDKQIEKTHALFSHLVT